jgi:hypothetical protein
MVLAIALWAPAASGANTSTGVQLLEECQLAVKETSDLTAPKLSKLVHCLGYLNGVSDSYKLWNRDHKFTKDSVPPPACLFDDVTTFELTRVVVKYLNDHPNKLHEDYGTLVTDALRDAYPCKR